MSHRGSVHGQESERLEIENPHWVGIAFEELAIALFAASQLLFGTLALGVFFLNTGVTERGRRKFLLFGGS